MRLVYKATQQPVKVGDQVQIGNGEFAVLDFLPPHKPEAQGKVAVGYAGESGTLFYVSVIGAEWIEREDRAATAVLGLAEQRDMLMMAINRLLASCSETEKLTDSILVTAISDPKASPLVREQAASVLQARQAVRAVLL